MKKRDGYGPNPADMPKLDEYGDMVKEPKPPTNKGSSQAERGRTKLRGRTTDKKLAKRKAIAKVLTMIPGSPTR